MKQETIATDYLKTICWYNNAIVDWAAGGKLYLADQKQLGEEYYRFGDAAIISANGQYAFIYKRLGTKGLLLKDGKLIREINRSYYCSEAYEYPAAFIDFKGKTYLVHCPLEYCRLDVEDVETGALITDVPGREPLDVFHSRLEVSPDGAYLMVKGWYWHPVDTVNIFNIADCMANASLLDDSGIYIANSAEVCTASFISNSKVLIGTSDELLDDEELVAIGKQQIGIWDIIQNKIIHTATVNVPFGNLFAINEQLAWDTYQYPKIINIKSGEVVDEAPSFNSGMQNSSISEGQPQIIFNRQTKQLAISSKECITVFTP